MKETAAEKVSAREFVDISVWIFKFLCSISRKLTISTMVFSSLDVLWGIADAYIISAILSKVVAAAQTPHAQITDILPYFYALLGVNAVFTVVGFFSSYSRQALNTVAETESTRKYYKRLEVLGIQVLERPDMNNRLQRASDALRNITDYYSQVVELCGAVVLLTISCLLLIKVAPLVLLVIVGISIPRFLTDKKFRGLTWGWHYKNTEERRKANWNAGELSNSTSLTEITVIKAQGFLDAKYQQFSTYFNNYSLRLQKQWMLFSNAYSLFTDAASYFGYIYLFIKFLAKTLDIGQVFFSIRMIGMFQTGLSRVFSIANRLFEYSLRFRELYLVFNSHEAASDGTVSFPALKQGPEIIINNVNFKYPTAEKTIFHNLSLHIKSGERVAVVGHNGSGKTTLVKLLCRIYQPTLGEILVNGVDLKSLKLETWYQNMGVLFQEYNQYPQLTVRENITIGDTSCTVDDQAVKQAAQSADALSFIEEYPHKFDQVLSEKFKGGVRPSTGQWQKLAIARFFYRNAPLVVFDEPTASIDAVSEYNIFNKIYDFFKGKTVIIISHRFSTVRNADRIIVLDHGEVVEQGSHDYLMGTGGYYSKAFNLQASGYTGE